MPRELPDYLVGQKGLNLVASPLHTPDGGLLVAQNVEYIRVFGAGGIGTRGGLARLNASPLAGAVLAFTYVPLATNAFGGGGGPATLLVALEPGASLGVPWIGSTDGAAFSTIAALTEPALYAYWAPDNTNEVSRPGAVSLASDAFYFVNDSRQLVKWNGATQTIPLPAFPASVENIYSLTVLSGLIYFDTHNGAPSETVYSWNPSTGVLTQIGTLTTVTGEYVPIGTNNVTLLIGLAATIPAAREVYALSGGSWLLDHTLGAAEIPASMLPFGGAFYLGTLRSGSSGAPIVLARSGAGVWSTSLTASDVDGAFGPFVEFDGKLFVCHWEPSAPVTKIYVFDGASWTLDEDLVSSFGFDGTEHPGQAVVFDGALYWAFPRPDDFPAENGSLLKRTAAGAWSQVINNRCLTGALGVVGA